MGLVGRFPEVDPREVDTADRIVVGGLVIDPAVGQVDSRGPPVSYTHLICTIKMLCSPMRMAQPALRI